MIQIGTQDGIKDFTSLEEFRRLKAKGKLTPKVTNRLSIKASYSFIKHYLTTRGYLEDAITLLCEISTLDDEDLAKPGLEGIFPLLVERLSDSFDPECCPLYDRAFTQIVQFCRRLPSGRALDIKLKQFGLETGKDLLDRKERIKKLRGKFDLSQSQPVKKVFILSRVTLGADVAVTSIIMAKIKQVFTNAELVILGDPKMRQLFGDDSKVIICEIQYERSDGLIQRLNSWLEVVEVIDREKRGLRPEEYLIVDPDSRLTQLGLLPLVENESRYYFFESRGYVKPGIGCISQLTLSWLNECFGMDDELWPYISLHEEDKIFGKQLCQKLRHGGADYLISISFGVGGNMRKRISNPFEERLILSLVHDGSVVILDKGFGEEEISRINRLISNLRAKDKTVNEINRSNASCILQAESISSNVVTWEGDIGPFCSLIAESDEYIGYDSAGQHIAAALEVPTIDIFSDSSYPLFSERWSPYGEGIVKVIRAYSMAPTEKQGDIDQILAEIIFCHKEIRKVQ